MRISVVVRFLAETDGAYRYREIDSDGVAIHGDREGASIGDIYLRKAAMQGELPKQLRIVIEEFR